MTRDSTTYIENSLIVIGIQWVDIYNDLLSKKETRKTIHSFTLLDNKELIVDKEVEAGNRELYDDLYYLNKFKFIFQKRL